MAQWHFQVLIPKIRLGLRCVRRSLKLDISTAKSVRMQLVAGRLYLNNPVFGILTAHHQSQSVLKRLSVANFPFFAHKLMLEQLVLVVTLENVLVNLFQRRVEHVGENVLVDELKLLA